MFKPILKKIPSRCYCVHKSGTDGQLDKRALGNIVKCFEAHMKMTGNTYPLHILSVLLVPPCGRTVKLALRCYNLYCCTGF